MLNPTGGAGWSSGERESVSGEVLALPALTVSEAHEADRDIPGDGDGLDVVRAEDVEEVGVGGLGVGTEHPAVRVTREPAGGVRLVGEMLVICTLGQTFH